MKLAEALMMRADMLTKIASLRARIARGAVVQEGAKPNEDPMALIKEASAVIAEHERLVVAINAANLRHALPDGRSLTAALAHREALTLQLGSLQAAIDATDERFDRMGGRDVKWTTTVDVPALQKQIEDLSRRLRTLNAMIQETNWQIDLDWT